LASRPFIATLAIVLSREVDCGEVVRYKDASTGGEAIATMSAMGTDTAGSALPGTAKERLEGGRTVPPWVRSEHEARYVFAGRFVRGRKVVDCACGSGISSRRFAVSGAERVEAFDLSKEAIDSAKQGGGEGDNLQFRVASAVSLPVSSGWADIYISLETIEHIQDDRGFLSEVTRVLADDGVFICSTPDRTITNPGRTLDDRPLNRFHVREYSRLELFGLLSAYFENVSLFGQNPCSARRAAFGASIARHLPGPLAARVVQLSKLRHLFGDSPDAHQVHPAREGERFEFVIAVCSGLRFANSAD
jgi:SAM-dependent methyltransferase